MKRALVFDSGVGGLSVADAMAGLALTIDYAADNAWLPYGAKSDAELRTRCPALIAALAAQLSPDVIVVACNTASTIALDAVRAAVPQPVVGVVPPIKPAAAMTGSGVIGLLATPATVRRAYTDDLIARFAADAHVVRFGSTALVAAAEAKLAGGAPDAGAVAEAIAGLFLAPRGEEIDVVALACTHFPLLAEELRTAAPRKVAWLDSGAAIARRVAEVSGCGAGSVQAARAVFTGPLTAALQRNAFERRGFSHFAQAPEGTAFTLSSA
ncbi:MAG: glutamate racemase [Hyphomonadaceae bacterium]|nr:glutamate racemase [Hyphomonadaceae bacterium]